MNLCIQLIFIYFLSSSINCDQLCSREDSRLVREYYFEALVPIYEKNHLSTPSECIFSSYRDIFYEQEFNKIKLNNDKWLCNYCNKTFPSEYYLDTHLSHRHNDTLIHGKQSVCLAEYCSIFRCDVLKRSKKKHFTFTVLLRHKKSGNEQQLIILRSRCASIINQCIPHHIDYDIRVKIQHEMYAEVCAYLTSYKYLELPNYRKSLIDWGPVLCLSILIGIAFIIIGFVRHADWRFHSADDDESEKHLSDETILIAKALLLKTPTTSIMHSSKTPSSTPVRHRVRFKSLSDN